MLLMPLTFAWPKSEIGTDQQVPLLNPVCLRLRQTGGSTTEEVFT